MKQVKNRFNTSTTGTITIMEILCQITTDPGLRNHENFSYGNTKNVLQPPPGFDSQPSEKKMSLEDAMVSFVEETKARLKKSDSQLDNIETHCSNMAATMKNLEVQIRQLATTINAQQRGTFPRREGWRSLKQ